jgi:DNA-binding IclR family transcriptional regulator
MVTGKVLKRKTYQVPALKRAFAIFDSLNHTSFGLTVQEVSQEHNIPYSTAFYLLETMRECGYAQRSEDSKKYRLGHKALGFRESNAGNELLDLRTIAKPVMEELSELTGLTIHLAILERDEAVYIEKVEPRGFVRLYTWIGKRNSLHCTAVGKALLMPLTEDEIRTICKPSNMIRRTERTIISVEALLSDIHYSQERGYSIDDIEDEPEGRAVAAPVYSSQGKAVASLGVAGSLSQLEFSRLDPVGKLVRNYAERTSQRLGHTNAAHAAATP